MPLPSPKLDDRSFDQLLDEAKALVARSDCGWTDLSAGDPGAVLLEAFAHITSLYLYRMNRLTEKVHVELLRLIGVKLAPPAAAMASLTFSLARVQADAVLIPAGTRVTVARATGGEAPVFTTLAPAVIPAGAMQVEDVRACHCSLVSGELAGIGTGQSGQSVQAAQAPVIAPSGDELDLVVGVEATPEELGERVPALSFEGRTYRIWTEVDNFTAGGPDGCSYVADRHSGQVTFASAVRTPDAGGSLSSAAATLARVPATGRAIRLWYRRGGGEAGNLPANALTVLRDPLGGVLVTNPGPTSGGAPAETVANALLRGPQEMHSLRRAVTARDFEAVALGSAAVARAKACTQAELWRHARAGTVEILLVPALGTTEQRGGGSVTREALQERESDEVRALVLAAVEQRRPLGTACLVNWVRYKTVTVKVRVVVYVGEDANAVRARVLERLHLAINPLPTTLQRAGRQFGEPLRASHVYDIVLAERGVNYVDQVRFVVDEVPDREVLALARDSVQPGTWYAASGQTLFRSLNDGDGWEPAGRFDGETVDSVLAHPSHAGLVAASTRLDSGGARVQVSRDCGETWQQVADLAFAINDLAWLERNGSQLLLLATDKGLYELALEDGASPAQLVVDAADPTAGFYAVVAFTDGRGGSNVAVAARQMGGVFLSRGGGRTETYARIHPGNEDIRVLGVQRLGLSSFLWAGITSAGNEAGKGCLRWELPSSPQSVESPDGWRALPTRWQGGSCRVLAFDGERVHAGTHSAGVCTLDGTRLEAGWAASDIHSGLPMRGSDKLFAPVQALAAAPGGRLLAGGPQGVWRSTDGGGRFEHASSAEFAEKVALPPTWLFCSGRHEVEVVSVQDSPQGGH